MKSFSSSLFNARPCSLHRYLLSPQRPRSSITSPLSLKLKVLPLPSSNGPPRGPTVSVLGRTSFTPISILHLSLRGPRSRPPGPRRELLPSFHCCPFSFKIFFSAPFVCPDSCPFRGKGLFPLFLIVEVALFSKISSDGKSFFSSILSRRIIADIGPAG